MNLKNKVFLITGASSGIGRETAVSAAASCAHLILAGRQKAALESTAEAVRAAGSAASICIVDISQPENISQAFNAAIAKAGRLDVLVNAAGIIGSGSISSTTSDAWQQMMQTNLDGVFHCMQAALPHLQSTGGNIVNVSSVTGTRAFPNVLAYCVSKAGVDQLTRCAALDLAPQGIRVNAVNPGVVETELHRRGGMDEEAYAAFLEHSKSTHPLGRVGNAADIAAAILYLASDQAGWVTGVTLNVDGGRHQTCAR